MLAQIATWTQTDYQGHSRLITKLAVSEVGTNKRAICSTVGKWHVKIRVADRADMRKENVDVVTVVTCD